MKNKKIVFVYGDFNILHPGHLRLLKFAQECGNYLIVGVNSNQQAFNRNILDEKVRLESLKATSYVDKAFILDMPVVDYIKKTKPDLIVKGKEHETLDNIEVPILESYGGKLLFTSGEIGFSSLDLLTKEFNISNYSNIKHSNEFLNRHNITKESLESIIHKFSTLNILVIGDTIIDEYITCDPVGMSQEDPTIVVTPISNKKFIGGAAIVASHAKTMGANVSYISVLGNDENCNFTASYLDNLDVDNHLIADTSRPTTLKQRFRANGKTLLRVNHLKQHDIRKEIETKIFNKIIKNPTKFDLIIFSDFSYGVLTKTLISDIQMFASKNKILMVADSQSSSQIGDISKFNNMHIITPTEREIRLSLNDFKSGLVVLSEKLQKKSNPKYIFTTLGSEGIVIFNNDKNDFRTDNISALNFNPKDESGAGDSLLTCSAMAYAVGASVWQSAYLGSIAAAIQVSRIGNIPIKKDEILRELNI